MLFEAKSSANSTWNSNLRVAYYFMAFMLDECEVRSYAIVPSTL